MTISGKTRLFALLGDPVGHSLSPAMHNAAIAHLGLDCLYIAFAVKPEKLQAAVEGLQACGALGFNVTIPHKQAVIPLLDRLSEQARAIEAVNTVRIEADGTLSGTNTDVEGFVEPLKGRSWLGATATVLGSGGAALAVIAGLQQLQFAQIQVVGRDERKLTRLRERLSVSTLPWTALASALKRTDLLVNTTPIGLDGIESPVGQLDMPPAATVYDLLYWPRPTRLLQLATERSLTRVDGLPMLVRQAEAALQFWTGKQVPAGIMASAAEAVLANPQKLVG